MDVPGPLAAPAETVTLPGSAGDMAVHIHRPSGPVSGAALVAHGRNGSADAVQIVPIIAACLARGLTVVVPDLCQSNGNASAGDGTLFTMADHHADTAAVLAFCAETLPDAANRILIGHSMGGYAVVRLAAEAYDPAHGSAQGWAPTGVIAVSPVVSGNALLAAREAMGPQALTILREELPHAPDEWPGHDALPFAARLAIPAAVVVGSEDTVTPPADAARLAATLPGCVWHDVVAGEHHCPVGAAYQASIGTALERIIEAR